MEGNRHTSPLGRLNIKPLRSRQKKSWSRIVDDPFSLLGFDKAEWVEDIQNGECSLRVVRESTR